MIQDAGNEPLADLSVRDFVDAVGARSSAPGGGSTAALIAALGAALGAMVGWLTYGRRRFEDVDPVMRRSIPPLYHAMRDLVSMIDADTDAFGDYLAALALPQDTDADRVARREAMQTGLRRAVDVPLTTMRIADRCWEAMLELARHGNVALRSDLEVGARALETGTWGAYRNVLINLGDIEDARFKDGVAEEGRGLVERAERGCGEVLRILAGREPA